MQISKLIDYVLIPTYFIFSVLAGIIAIVVLGRFIFGNYSDSSFAPLIVLTAFYIMVCYYLLIIGLKKRQKWVLVFHTGLFIYMMLALIPFIPMIFRGFERARDFESVTYLLVLVILPIGFQAIVSIARIRGEISNKGPLLDQGTGLLLIVPLLPLFVYLLMYFSIPSDEVRDQDRYAIAWIENNRYTVTVYQNFGNHATVGDYCKVIRVDKSSFLKGEKLIYEPSCGNPVLEFIDSSTVAFQNCPECDTTLLYLDE